MKGVIAIICAMSMCLLLIVTAFAAETSGNSFAIHAEKAEREAVLAEMRQTASNATLQEWRYCGRRYNDACLLWQSARLCKNWRICL